MSILLTDSKNGRWVDTEICGLASLVLLKDVGKPITMVRVHQEHVESGLVGEIIFAYELPLNVAIEKLSPNLTSIGLMDGREFLGLYFRRSVADCVKFNMKLDELEEELENDGFSA